MDLNAGGEISDRKIGITPSVLTKPSRRSRNSFQRKLRNLPLDAKLNEESTSGELAECIRDDPERNEHSDEEDENAEKEGMIKLDVLGNALVGRNTYMIVRRRPMY